MCVYAGKKRKKRRIMCENKNGQIFVNKLISCLQHISDRTFLAIEKLYKKNKRNVFLNAEKKMQKYLKSLIDKYLKK